MENGKDIHTRRYEIVRIIKGIDTGMNPLPKWRFREMQPGEINVDPIEGQFFTTEVLSSINDALVREAIQNSLDAAADEGPVTVRFSFLSLSSRKTSFVRDRYLDGLLSHLRARDAGLAEIPADTEPLSFLLIEDFGTRGLQGDVSQYDDLDDDIRRNDFYYFWRNIGRTRKGDTDLGRWGLGKTVFQAASRINSFFGLTVRRDDGRRLLMGQSVLKIHRVDGKRYAPYGYFALFNGHLALPVADGAAIDPFCVDFSVNRGSRPGLSILVPFPDPDLDSRQCIKSIVKHYFFPILSGALTVEVHDGSRTHTLNGSSLERLMRNNPVFERIGMRGVVDLAQWALGRKDSEFETLQEPPPGRAPKLRADRFDKGQLERLAERFHRKQRIALHVPISVQRKNRKEIVHTGFSIFLERDDTLDKAEDHFIRQGITVPEVTSLKHKGVRAIVSVTDRALSTFLGDAENPAHTEWERNNKRFKQRYLLGPTTLDYVKTSPREIVKLLTQPRKGRDETLLRHLFSLPESPIGKEGSKPTDRTGKGEPGTVVKPFIDVAGAQYLQLYPIKGGFKLVKKPSAKLLPRIITVQMAYEVRSGNPFKKYTPLDFDVSREPIFLSVEGAQLMVCRNNVLQVEVKRPDFVLAVVGFDSHRDLRIKTTP